MFEGQTFETIMERLLARAPADMDKRQGSVVYDMLAPAALEMVDIYNAMDMVLNEGFADTASYYYLIKRAAERGLLPRQATKATWKGVFQPSAIIVPTGSRFCIENLNYEVTGYGADGSHILECETDGTAGNSKSGTLIPIDYIDGLTGCELTELLVPGEEEETQEDFRDRYYASVNAQTFGGNQKDYEEWVNAIQGVGAVKVYPVWNGGGTVKLVIINSEYSKPSVELVQLVQEAIDPEVNHGKGLGLAPIGHNVTVEGVQESPVNVETVITYKNGWDYDRAKVDLEAAFDAYLLELRKTWSAEEQLVVRISQIENHILNLQGVLDIKGTKINGLEENLTISVDHVPVRGDILA